LWPKAALGASICRPQAVRYVNKGVLFNPGVPVGPALHPHQWNVPPGARMVGAEIGDGVAHRVRAEFLRQIGLADLLSPNRTEILHNLPELNLHAARKGLVS